LSQAAKDGRPVAQEAVQRNGKPPATAAAADAKPRTGLDGDWRMAKEKGEGPRDRPDDMRRPSNGAPLQHSCVTIARRRLMEA
jgi:hypothetical protein